MELNIVGIILILLLVLFSQKNDYSIRCSDYPALPFGHGALGLVTALGHFLIGNKPQTNDNTKANNSAINCSTTCTFNDSTTTFEKDVIVKPTNNRSLANQSYVTDTDGTSSYSYVIPVVSAMIIAGIVVGVLVYYRYLKSKRRRGPNGENVQEQKGLVDMSQNTSLDTSAL